MSNATKNGSQETVLMALDTFARDGATTLELFEYIGADLQGKDDSGRRKALSNALYRLKDAGEIVQIVGRYYVKQYAPVPAKVVVLPHANGSAGKTQIAPYANKRTGKTISIYKSPIVYSDAIALAFLIDEQWYKMPLFGSVRICIGAGDPPMWSADQEMYRGVVRIRITHKGGTATEEHTSPSDIITIAPEE